MRVRTPTMASCGTFLKTDYWVARFFTQRQEKKKRQDQTAALGLLRFFSPSVPTPASDRGPHSRT